MTGGALRRWAAIAASIATICLASVQISLTGWRYPFDPTRMPFVRTSLGAVVLLTVFRAVGAMIGAYHDQGRTKWWNSAGVTDGRLEWSDVYALVSAEREFDPLAFAPVPRTRPRLAELASLLVASLASTAVASQALVFLWDPSGSSWLLGDGSDRAFASVVSASGNLTAYLALLTSAVAIVFTYHQLRAKVRAESRQQWIIKARSLVAETLSLRRRRDSRWPGATKARERLEEVRLELELMLNPSERDHRLLMYLVQRLSFLSDLGSDDIQDAVAVRHEIAEAGAANRAQCGVSYAAPDGGPTHPSAGTAWNEVLYADREGDLVSYVMRLSHAVFKREWERVKHTR